MLGRPSHPIGRYALRKGLAGLIGTPGSTMSKLWLRKEEEIRKFLSSAVLLSSLVTPPAFAQVVVPIPDPITGGAVAGGMALANELTKPKPLGRTNTIVAGISRVFGGGRTSGPLTLAQAQQANAMLTMEHGHH